MPKAHLTDIAIKALRPPRKGQETYWDQTLTGFGVRVSQGGGKSFIVMHGANRKRTSIGKYPIITLSDARTAAKRLLAEQTLGKHAPLSVGFETACNEYLAECAGRIGEGTLSGCSSRYTRRSPGGHKQRCFFEDGEATGLTMARRSRSSASSQEGEGLAALGPSHLLIFTAGSTASGIPRLSTAEQN